MALGRKGGDVVVAAAAGSGGGGEKVSGACSVSNSRIAVREAGWSQGGGRMLARRWRLRRRASQRGMSARWGGLRAGVGPCRRAIGQRCLCFGFFFFFLPSLSFLWQVPWVKKDVLQVGNLCEI